MAEYISCDCRGESSKMLSEEKKLTSEERKKRRLVEKEKKKQIKEEKRKQRLAEKEKKKQIKEEERKQRQVEKEKRRLLGKKSRKLKHKDWKVRLEAVKEIDDPDLLIEIIQRDENRQVRDAAIENIGDEAILIDIAKTKYPPVIPKPKGKVLDMNLYENNIKSRWFRVRQVAVRNINDEDVLKDFAKNDYLAQVRKEAVKKISDENFLADIARNDSESYVRKEAIYNIQDESILVDVAINDPNDYIRKRAADKLSVDSYLWDAISKSSDEDKRELYHRTYKWKHFDEFIEKSPHYYNDYLKKFERQNYSTPSIYDLKDFEALFIDSSGNNYTSWNEYYIFVNKKAKNIEEKMRYEEKSSPWATGHEHDRYFGDDIKFISENYKKNLQHIHNYKVYCKQAYVASFLDPTTDRPTELERYFLCLFKDLEGIVINNLTSDHKLTFENANIRTISFNNCDFSNMAGDELFKDCDESLLIGDESALKSLKLKK